MNWKFLATQIFDEIYCKESEYSAIVDKFGVSSKYKVIKI